MKDSFIFYKSFYDSIHRLNNKELKADIFEAICELALYNNDIELSNNVGLMIMDLIKPQIKANNQRYENGKKGGRPKKETNSYEKEKTTGYLKTKTIGYVSKKPNVNVNDNENVNVNDKYIYFQNKNLENIFCEFLQIRKKLKAVNSERAIKMLIKKLEKYDDETKYKMIEQSIIKSWKDIYEIKEDKKVILEKPSWLNKTFNEKDERKLMEEDYEIIRKLKESD